jgi:hypothetical protein
LQVDQANGAFSAQLLQQLETDMLLGLVVMQLTASIPDSHPRAEEARDLACELGSCDPLHSFWMVAGLHQLPRPAAYTGPQLALQLLPSLLKPRRRLQRRQPPQQLPLLDEQQEQQQSLLQEQQQSLLQERQQHQQLPLQSPQEPLLPQQQALQQAPPVPQQQQSLQRPHLQQQQPAPEQRQQHPQQQQPLQQQPPPLQGQQQQQQPPQVQQQQQGAQLEWFALTPSAAFLTELLPLLTRHGLAQLRQQEEQQQQQQQQQPQLEVVSPWQVFAQEKEVVMACLLCRRTLLYCSAVPAPGAAVALQLGGSSAGADQMLSYHCAVPADLQAAYMPHVCDIISILEGALRLAAAASEQTAGACGVSTGPETAAKASGLLSWLVAVLARVLYPGYSGPLLELARTAGPGSQAQRQLHSLLASMVKLSWGLADGRLSSQTQLDYGSAAVYAASALLSGATAMQQEQQHRVGAAGQGTGSCGGAAAAAAMLPSVIIVGRCCMQWFKQQDPTQLQQQQQQVPRTQDEQREFLEVRNSAAGALISSLTTVQQWLAAGGTCSQLSAAGYAPQAVLQQLSTVNQQLKKGHRIDAASNLMASRDGVQAVGLAMCSFAAVPCMCNNPGCTSMAGLSELATVSGRSCICGGCRVARYCSRACQRASWKQHKPVCAALSAAAAAAEGEKLREQVYYDLLVPAADLDAAAAHAAEPNF